MGVSTASGDTEFDVALVVPSPTPLIAATLNWYDVALVRRVASANWVTCSDATADPVSATTVANDAPPSSLPMTL